MNSLELDSTAQHMDNLIRNLSGSNLEVDKIERDGTFFSDLFEVVPGSTPRLRLYKANWSASCQLGFLTLLSFFFTYLFHWP